MHIFWDAYIHLTPGLNRMMSSTGGVSLFNGIALSWKFWTPPPPKMDPQSRYFEIFRPPVQIFRNIWTSIELIFQELDEIFRLPLKFLDPFYRGQITFFKTILKAKIVKTQCYYVNFIYTVIRFYFVVKIFSYEENGRKYFTRI